MSLFYRAAGAILAPFRYAEREVNHMKEVAKEDLQAFMANAIKMAAIGIVAFLFLLFGSISAASAINQATESQYLGYLIVAGFYLLVGVGLYIWKMSADKKHEKEHDALNVRRPIHS
ncbi:MAG TPA: phage holin family protein [Chryseosolibacter sp.]